MKRSTAVWSLAGVVAGFAGLAVDHALTEWWNQKHAVIAVADVVVNHAPADLVNWGRDHHGKALTVPGALVVLTIVFAVVGRLTRRRWWMGVAGYGAVSAIGVVAILDATAGVLPQLFALALGFAAMTVAMSLLADRLRRLQAVDDHEVFGSVWRSRRRDFLIVVGAVAGVAGIAGVSGRFLSQDARKQKQEREILRLPVTKPDVPDGASIGVDGVQPWMTPADDFYLIDTSFSYPVLLAEEWTLRIHGMVERELELTFNDLVERQSAEAWVTLNCVSNQVGGDLIGNAWWSGALLAPILAQAGPLAGSDAVLQTSSDGWTCATPLEAMTDDRNAMLAVAMNGRPLTKEHGYPVRTIVPGLYGYVSATKWVVDLEVTRFDQVSAYWTDQDWSELGPVKMSSTVEVPGNGDELDAGEVVIAGTAWHQHTGIATVEVQVDGGPWTPAELARVPNADTWVQWRATADLEPGDHVVTVRATDRAGEVQTAAIADDFPDGATGWHSVDFSVA